MSKKVLQILQAQFGDAIVETHSHLGDDTAVVAPARWREVARFLRDDPRCAFDMFVDITAVDHQALGGAPGGERFEVVCHLRSLQYGHRVRIKARVGELDLAPTEGVEIDSLVPVWKGANWFERETFDMFGVVFKDHPDLRRMLMYPEFVGHPLRKDYAANAIQPLIPFRDVPGKLPPFGPDEGMSFGRQTHEQRMWDTENENVRKADDPALSDS